MLSSQISIALRSAQIVLAVLSFILAIVVLADLGGDYGLPAISIVSAIFSLAFYICVLLPQTIKYISPAIALGCELWTCIWWLIAMACSASDFGLVSCRYWSAYVNACRAGKALIAFNVLGWVVSLATLGLLSYYGIHLTLKATGSEGLLVAPFFSRGALFATEDPVAVDLEKTTAEDAVPVEDSVVGTQDQSSHQSSDPAKDVAASDTETPYKAPGEVRS